MQRTGLDDEMTFNPSAFISFGYDGCVGHKRGSLTQHENRQQLEDRKM
jgi:hypothetical protein